MVLPGHIAGGYLAAAALLSLSHPALSPSEAQALLALGALAGEGPDVDLVWFWWTQKSATAKKTPSHRDYLTHAPALWLVAASLVAAVGYAAGSSFVFYAGAVILCGSLSHFLLDSIEDGVRWLWPFSKRYFYLIQTEASHPVGRPGSFAFHVDLVRRFYVKKATFYVEILVTLIALYVALR